MKLLAGAMVLLSVAAVACDTSNYAFKVDESIKIAAPTARSEVSLPVMIRWTDSKPFSAPRVAPQDPTAEYYGVFVDNSPLAPGKRLESLVPGDTPCEISQGCPSEKQLSDARAFLTAKQSVLLEFIADLRPTSRGNTKDTHEVTIVRMRGDKRVGEAAFRQTFFVQR